MHRHARLCLQPQDWAQVKRARHAGSRDVSDEKVAELDSNSDSESDKEHVATEEPDYGPEAEELLASTTRRIARPDGVSQGKIKVVRLTNANINRYSEVLAIIFSFLIISGCYTICAISPKFAPSTYCQLRQIVEFIQCEF